MRDLNLTWLRMKRHLKSCGESSRALRDAARALSSGASFSPAPFRERLCRPSS
jgi:hypothetical protein